APLHPFKVLYGIERVSVQLPRPVRIEADQFFVSIEDLSPGMLLLSNKRKIRPICESRGEQFTNQLLKLKSGEWKNGRYAFAIDVRFEADDKQDPPMFADMTKDLHLLDSVPCNRNIAWAFLTSAEYPDLLFGGKLYSNN